MTETPREHDQDNQPVEENTPQDAEEPIAGKEASTGKDSADQNDSQGQSQPERPAADEANQSSPEQDAGDASGKKRSKTATMRDRMEVVLCILLAVIFVALLPRFKQTEHPEVIMETVDTNPWVQAQPKMISIGMALKEYARNHPDGPVEQLGQLGWDQLGLDPCQFDTQYFDPEHYSWSGTWGGGAWENSSSKLGFVITAKKGDFTHSEIYLEEKKAFIPTPESYTLNHYLDGKYH